MQFSPTLHEAAEEKFVETVNRLIRDKNLPARVQKRRKDAPLMQKELAERSGVKLRTIRQYEMRTKSISKAVAETLQQPVQVPLCSMEDLLKYQKILFRRENIKTYPWQCNEFSVKLRMPEA